MAKPRWGSVLGRVHTLLDEGAVGAVPDGILLERYAGGDRDSAERSFAALVDRHGPMVLRVCRSVLRDEHAAHDAFQATFLVLARKARSLWVHESIAPWLYRVAVHTSSAARNAAARRRRHEQKAAEQATPHAEVAEAEESGPILHQEIDRLPERYRAAIVLCYLEGLTHEQAAERLDCPVGTVRSRLATGRDRLRRRLILRGLSPDREALEPISAEGATTAVPAGLAASAIRISMTQAGAPATGVVPAAVAALAREELTMMMVARLKYVIPGLLLAIVGSTAGVLALAQRAEAPDQSEPPQPRAGAAAPMSPSKRRFIEARIELASALVREDLQRTQHTVGRVDLLFEDICVWSRRLMEDRLSLASGPAQRLAAIREHRNRMILMDQLVGQYARAGQARNADALKARYYRTEADQLLSEAGVDLEKEPPPPDVKEPAPAVAKRPALPAAKGEAGPSPAVPPPPPR